PRRRRECFPEARGNALEFLNHLHCVALTAFASVMDGTFRVAFTLVGNPGATSCSLSRWTTPALEETWPTSVEAV
ncbi:unnamed protein product, partial [Ascophyllum nodosum]